MGDLADFGLPKDTIDKIWQVFKQHPQIESAVLYGSRAKGNARPGSDIDLTLFGGSLSTQLLANIIDELDDLLLPYMIDLSIFDNIQNAYLKMHIERVGKIFYKAEKEN